MDPVHELMRAHRSVRRYLPDPVDDALVREAVLSAQHAATSHAVQAYGVLRLRDPVTRARLAELCGDQAQVAAAPVLLVVCGDQRRHRLVAAARGAAYVPNLETFVLALVDASLFAQNLALALESSGLGICFIGGLRNRLAEVDRLLAVPAGVLPLYGLCAGWPDEDPPARPRLPLEGVLFDERWPQDREVLAAVARHDREVERWNASRGRPRRTWSDSVTRLFARATREHLRVYYESKGAELS